MKNRKVESTLLNVLEHETEFALLSSSIESKVLFTIAIVFVLLFGAFVLFLISQ